VKGLRAYVQSEAFRVVFNGLDPGRRQSAMRAFVEAEGLCEARSPRPLARPRPIDAARAQKAKWDSAMRAKLAHAYARVGDDDEAAARLLGVSVGAARLAKRRHLSGKDAGECKNGPAAR
jgi:hypothetical protein